MSTYLQVAEGLHGAQLGTILLPKGLEEAWPEVSKIFTGSFNPETGFWKVPPASLTLFVEGGRLKFVCNPRGFPHVCFGTVSEASDGVLGVEKALRDGNCEWKPRSAQKSR